MDLNLDTGILTAALQQYAHDKGRGALAELHKISGVHNLGRISRGETVPTLDTWLQLYLAARNDIPPPTTVSGGRLVLIGGDDEPLQEKINIVGIVRDPLEGESRLRALYAAHRSPAVVRAFTDTLERIKKATRVKI